jgi:hypothetical protein
VFYTERCIDSDGSVCSTWADSHGQESHPAGLPMVGAGAACVAFGIIMLIILIVRERRRLETRAKIAHDLDTKLLMRRGTTFQPL